MATHINININNQFQKYIDTPLRQHMQQGTGFDKSLLCLLAQMTFWATALLSLETKIIPLLVAQHEKMVAPGIRACDLASPEATVV